MQFFTWTFIRGRLRAIVSMMKDKTVPLRKKALVVFGLIYLLLPVDLIPPDFLMTWSCGYGSSGTSRTPSTNIGSAKKPSIIRRNLSTKI